MKGRARSRMRFAEPLDHLIISLESWRLIGAAKSIERLLWPLMTYPNRLSIRASSTKADGIVETATCSTFGIDGRDYAGFGICSYQHMNAYKGGGEEKYRS